MAFFSNNVTSFQLDEPNSFGCIHLTDDRPVTGPANCVWRKQIERKANSYLSFWILTWQPNKAIVELKKTNCIKSNRKDHNNSYQLDLNHSFQNKDQLSI
jgi:hypothetical protein